MCNQFTFHHQFRIDTGRTKFEQKTDSIFLLVDAMDKEHKDPDTIDLEAPRLAQNIQKAWKKYQNTVYWVDIKLAQKKGVKFYQTRSNAIILYSTLPACCIPKVVRMEIGEIIHEKVFESPELPPKISLRHDWMKELGSEVARQPEGSQPTQPNPNPNHDRTGRPVVIGQPVGSSSTFNEVDIDFRISGLPHSVVKQAENSHVRELVKKIENHFHRQDIQADLQHNNAYNPFSEKSKKMIEDMGNVELFVLCETIPKVQCKECLLYWNQGIVCCFCGQFLIDSEASRGILQWTLDLLSIQNYVIKKERPHGHRYGMTKEQGDHLFAHDLRKRCIKRHFEGIHDRFLKDPGYRESQLEIDRTEEVCIQMDKDAQKDFTYRVTQAEFFRYKKNWWISLNKSGPVRDRSDFNDALTTLNRLHQESGEEQLRPIPFWKWHPSSNSSSSTTWW